MTTALPVENEKYWLEIVLSIATIPRTWGMRWVPVIAWYVIIPAMVILEIVMFVAIFICYMLYNRGLVTWAKRFKYLIYALGAFFTITLFPLVYGMTIFFDCNWEIGVLNRDNSLKCWDFTNTGILGLCLYLLYYFYITLYCKLFPKWLFLL